MYTRGPLLMGKRLTQSPFGLCTRKWGIFALVFPKFQNPRNMGILCSFKKKTFLGFVHMQQKTFQFLDMEIPQPVSPQSSSKSRNCCFSSTSSLVSIDFQDGGCNASIVYKTHQVTPKVELQLIWRVIFGRC